MGKLTAVSCAKLGDGRYGDGDGLSLLVRGATRAWTYSYTLHGQRREMGLGKLSVVGLAEARKLAADARALVRQGTDPIQQRKVIAQERQPITALTLRKVARTYHEAFVEPVLTTKHARQWINSIEQHIPDNLLDIAVADIEPGKLLTIMQPLYACIPETARRVRQRLDVIYDYAILQGLTKTNPAQVIARTLRQKRERGQFKSMPYTELPAFMAELRERPGISARALELLILTAARTDEVRRCRWDEIRGNLWTIPGERMKAGEGHTVYLSPQAMHVLETVEGISEEWVFPISDPDQPMSNMAMLTLLTRMRRRNDTTVHGFRSSFSTWANETDAARPDVIEACLAHQETDRVRKAYNRSQFAEARKNLLAAWADYLDGKSNEQKREKK